MPIVQVTFTVAAGLRDDAALKGRFVAKGLVATVALAGALGFLATYYPAFCGGAVGVRLCEPAVMMPLMLAALVLCALRVLVLIRLAERRHGLSCLLLVPLLGVPLLFNDGGTTMLDLAQSYAIVTVAALALFAVAFVLTSRPAERP